MQMNKDHIVENTPENDATTSAPAPAPGALSGLSGQAGPSAQPKGEKNAPPIRVLVADDHKIVREGLIYSLDNYPCVKLVGAAENGKEAIEMTLEHRPDVVVMDVSMPVLDGIEATRQIHEQMPEVKVIGLSMHDSDEIRHALLSAGATTYLTKNGAMEELIAAIQRCAA